MSAFLVASPKLDGTIAARGDSPASVPAVLTTLQNNLGLLMDMLSCFQGYINELSKLGVIISVKVDDYIRICIGISYTIYGIQQARPKVNQNC